MARRHGAATALATILALGATAPSYAAEAAPTAVAQAPPKPFVTHHVTTIRGGKISYTATAGETWLTNLAGEPIGSIFSFAYVKDGPADPNRPVLFVFNGGPGSSSLWLHMGVVGPRKVVLDHQVNPSNVPPFGVADNPDSLLDVADLVFIDPIGTGFSRVIGKGTPADFYGVDEDANSVAQFIELWLGKNGRWTSPKFVMGESYGSVRAAVMPRALMGGPTYLGVMRGITLNGIILLGATLSPHAGEPSEGREWTAATTLPTFAATAWYHGKVAHTGSLAAFEAEVTRFAQTDYVAALQKATANTLTGAEREAVVARLTAYTGLPAKAFQKDLAISTDQFQTALLADRGLSLGLYDSRYTLPTANGGHEPVADDPAMGQYVPGFVAAFHQMLHNDLKVDLDRPYGAIVWRDLLANWKWDRAQVEPNQSFAVDLAIAMRRNPRLRLLVAAGDYDLVTTPGAARRQLDQANLPAGRVTYRNYESGHMLYVGDTAAAFSDDVRALIRSATAPIPAATSPR
jgi:carboxypeptidase C (cathepsin A)